MLSDNSESNNRLLSGSFNTHYETVPFKEISNDQFMPAFLQAIEEGRKEIRAITDNATSPDFPNTIEALDKSLRLLNRVSNVFFNLNHAETSEQMQQIAQKVAPLLSDFENDITFSKKLFQRVKNVYDNRKSLNLTAEQKTLLEKTYLRFFRNGAAIDDLKQNRLREISRELSELSLKFDENVLAETNNFTLHVEDEKELAGLPESVIDSALHEALERSLQGWVFTLQAPSYWPFMKYAENRKLREKMFRAMGARCFRNNEHNNTGILKKIVNLRLERVNLLGYPTHAHFVLEERMAKKPEAVNDFLEQLVSAAKPVALKDVDQVIQFIKEEGYDCQLQHWDWGYFAEKLKKKLFEFDEEQFRPYFELKNVRRGAFALAARIWGLSFRPNDTVQVYHPDVQVYEVYSEEGPFLAMLYLDFFPRKGKSPGAWMTTYRDQETDKGKNIRPHVSLVFNFPKPRRTNPSLLNFSEFCTYLHEFGHALHGMLSDVNYLSLSGTSVCRDFVELPSQFLENWATERNFLNIFARHYETDEPIPEDLIDKVKGLRKFHAAYNIMRQVSYGLIDMAWHTMHKPLDKKPESFEADAIESVRLLPDVDNIMISTAFSHIFAGGYSAGYYSYKWAEVLDADAFMAFKENGIFDYETAKNFKESILSKGGSKDPMELFKRFRGREPDIEAMLERDGLRGLEED